MSIRVDNSESQIAVSQRGAAAAAVSSLQSEQVQAGQGASNSDSVHLSRASDLINMARNFLSTPDRASRIERLRTELQQGSYRPNDALTARALLKAL